MVQSQPKKRRLQLAKSPKRVVKAEKTRKSKLGKTVGPLLHPFRVFRFLRFLVPSYFRNSFKELKQVTWPTRKETIKLTFAVFMFAIVFGIFITIVDYGLNAVFKRILLK